MARLAIRHARLELNPPKGDSRFQQPLPVGVVYVLEENSPTEAAPIEWMLLTTEAADTFKHVCERVDWYGCRWIIEEWHKVEKTGCRLEASQLKDAEAIKCLAAFIAVVAVRMVQLRDLAQMAAHPSVEDRDPADASAHRPQALQALVPRSWIMVVSRLAKCGPELLTPRMFWLTIAKRGGWVGRKSDGPPGWQTIWQGWYDVMMMVTGVEMCMQPPRETYG